MSLYTVSLESDEFGAEDFVYESEAEAEAGAERLRRSAEKHAKQDGIERRIIGPTRS